MMGHLGKSAQFWRDALALHDEFGALGGEKKRIELAEGLQAALDRDSGKEAMLAKAKADKRKPKDQKATPEVGTEETGEE